LVRPFPPDRARTGTKTLFRFLEGLPFEDAQRRRIRQFIEGYGQRGQQREMKAVNGTVAFLTQRQEREAPLCEVALRMSRPAALRNLADEAEAGDTLAAWLLAQYHAVHPVLAPAQPGGRLTPAEQTQVQQFMAGANAQLQGLVAQQQQKGGRRAATQPEALKPLTLTRPDLTGCGPVVHSHSMVAGGLLLTS
jgi:hypothetical protein